MVWYETLSFILSTLNFVFSVFLYTLIEDVAVLIFIGCVLAYKTRDLDPKFGEAKQLCKFLLFGNFEMVFPILAFAFF
jgi:hypothetical protein